MDRARAAAARRAAPRAGYTHTQSSSQRATGSAPVARSLSPRYVVAHAASRRVPAADAPDVRRPPRLSAPLLALALLPRLPAPSRRPEAAPPTAPPPLRHDANGLRARELLEVRAEQLGLLDGAAARRARPLAARHLARGEGGCRAKRGAVVVGPGRRGRRRGGGGGRRRTASSGGMRQWRCQASGQSSQRSSSPAPPQSAHASSSQSGQSQSPPTSSGGGAGSRQPTWKRLPHEG